MERSLLVRVVLVLVGIGAGLYLSTFLWTAIQFFGDVILVLFLGWILASMLRRLGDVLVRRLAMPVLVARLIAYLLFLLPFILVLGLLVPLTFRQLAQVAEAAPAWFEGFPGLVDQTQDWLRSLGLNIDLEELSRQTPLVDAANSLAGIIGQNALGIAQGVGMIVFQGVLVLVVAFYLLIDGDRLSALLFSVTPRSYSGPVWRIAGQMEHTFNAYIRGMLLIGGVYAAGTAVVMLAQGLPFVLPVSVAAGFLIIMPFLGDIVAITLPVLVAFFSATTGTTIVTLAVLMALQQVMTNIVSPRVLAQAVEMPALLVLLSVIVGAKIAGVWGAILGVPVMAATYCLVMAWLSERAAGTSRQSEEDVTQQEESASPGS